MKVFLSHKKEDSALALMLKKAFETEKVDTYLDLLDNNISVNGKELTDHIKKQLNICTDIIVVMSDKTKQSWWVPFEIGMSAQVDMPTASFLSKELELPEFLVYWPRLRSELDVIKYVTIRKKVEQEIKSLFEKHPLMQKRNLETNEFYRQLKENLR